MHIRQRLSFTITTEPASHRISTLFHPPTAYFSRADEPSQHTSSFTLLPPPPLAHRSLLLSLSPSLPLSLSPSLPPLSLSLTSYYVSSSLIHDQTKCSPLIDQHTAHETIIPLSLIHHPALTTHACIHHPPPTRSANPSFTSLHLYIFTSLPLYIFTSLHLYIFTSLHLYISPSLPLYISTSFPLYIFTSSAFTAAAAARSQQRVRVERDSLGGLCIMCHVLCVMGYVLWVMCHVLCVMCLWIKKARARDR